MFAAAVVRTDASEKPDGDGVTELRRELRLQGTASASEGACSLADQARSGPRGVLALLALCAALLGQRRGRSRKAR